MYSPKSVVSDSILQKLKEEDTKSDNESNSDESDITQHSDCIAAISRHSKRFSAINKLRKSKPYSPRLLSIIKRQASVTNDVAIVALRQANGDVADAIFNLTYGFPRARSDSSVTTKSKIDSNMDPSQDYQYLSSSVQPDSEESGSQFTSSSSESSEARSVLSDTPPIIESPSKSSSTSNPNSSDSSSYVKVVSSSSKEDSVAIDTHPSYRHVIDSLPSPSGLLGDSIVINGDENNFESVSLTSSNSSEKKKSMESLTLPPVISKCPYSNDMKEVGIQTDRVRNSTRRFERGLINAVIGHVDLALHEFETCVIQLQLKEHRILKRMSRGKRELDKSIANMMNEMLMKMKEIQKTQERHQWNTQIIIFLWPLILLFLFNLFQIGQIFSWELYFF